MNTTKYLAIDLGASSGRGIIGSFDGKKITLVENHRFPNIPVKAAGQYTWDILRIYHEIEESIRKCSIGDDRDVASVGIDTWGVDFGLLDKSGHLLGNPVHYRDARNDAMPEYAATLVSPDWVYEKTGIQVVDFNTLYQLLAVKKNSPELLEVAQDMLFIPDLLNYFLTGIKQTEYTIASTSQMLDAKARDWSWELIEKFGLPKKLFRKIIKPATPVGMLRNDVREELGGIGVKVVSVAAHDTGSAVMAVPAEDGKFIWISSGTWSIMGTEAPEPIISARTRECNFTNEGGADDTIRFSKNITGLWLEQESRNQWKKEGEDISFADLSKMASSAKPFKCFIDPDDPRFAPPGNMPQRIVDYCRETGQPEPDSTGEIVRCILESLALKYRYTVDMIDELGGERLPMINVVGGGTKEEPLMQFTANACGRPVAAGPIEATALGNIVAQAIAAGEIKDVKEGRQVISDSFDISYYSPKDVGAWDAAYETFRKVTKC